MLVTRSNFQECVEPFRQSGFYGCDTETDGLLAYQGNRLFSIILATESEAFYFNFNPQIRDEVVDEEFVLGPEHIEVLQEVFNISDSIWCMHNAKFDLAMLHNEGIEVAGTVHCTEAVARVERNDHFNYSLDACAKRIGEEKSKAVDAYIREHGLYINSPTGEFTEKGKPKFEKIPQYKWVPFPVIVPYGCKDAKLTRTLGVKQMASIAESGNAQPENWPKPLAIMYNERRLTKTILKMERVGVKIDREYCVRAKAHEESRMEFFESKYMEATGFAFKDSNKAHADVFDANGISYGTTEKGNPSFKDDVLETIEHPVAEIIRNWRSAAKKVSTYYSNFLFFSEDDDIIHANIRQAGTATGRVSCAQPNLQNLNKEEDPAEEFLVRRAFVPRDDFCLVSIDYDQMEYRLMLEYAKEIRVIRKILEEGLDVHKATAEMMGVTRQEAKTLNFLLLYGGGAGKLAKALGVPLHVAQALRQRYFRALPMVSAFIRGVMQKAEQRGFIFNWAGRKYTFPDKNFAYKAPNYLIQGGCAEIVKFAMNDIDDFLIGYKSRMLLQVHDELLFEVHKSELDIVPELKQRMEAVFKHKLLPLTAGASYSWKSWADKEDGFPQEKAA